jgi:thymidine kinase
LKILAQADTIITNTIICSLCGSAGHITSDCKQNKSTGASSSSLSLNQEEQQPKQPTWMEREKMDSEVIIY